MLDRYLDIYCDGCDTPNDSDPLALMGLVASHPPTVHDPDKIKELTYFWLCEDCSPEYPKGSQDFFRKEYFTEDELFLCIHCKGFIPEDVRDQYEDTEVCLVCSPDLEEAE